MLNMETVAVGKNVPVIAPEVSGVDSQLQSLEKEFVALAQKKVELLKEKLQILDSLLVQRQAIQEQLRQLETLLRQPSSETGLLARPPRAGVVPGNYAELTVWEGAREVLHREGREMLSSEIAAALKAGGKRLGAHASSQVNASMSQKKDVFVCVTVKGKSRWRLKEWDGEGKGQREQGLAPTRGH